MAGETGESIWSGGTDAQTSSATGGWIQVATNSINTPHFEGEVGFKTDKRGLVHPRLYFKYLKSKLSIIEMHAFKKRMSQLEKMADEYASLGQEALSEECIKHFYLLAREFAMFACGIKTFITEEHLEKFRYRIKGSLKVTPIKNFARVIPEKATRNIKWCIEKKLFDDFVVVHLDDRKDSVKETEKEKIERKKDPICFGRIAESDNYYFVADWEDELCTLKLSDVIKKLSLKKADITMKSKMEKPEGK